MNSPQGSGPAHVAIIMDGNGRWAAAHGKIRTHGHRAGARVTRRVVEAAPDLGIRVLTLFAFSSENWQRPSPEIRVLMDLFLRTLRREVRDLRANGVRLRFIGDRRRLSRALQSDMRRAEMLTADNSRLDLLVAMDYGGQWDITQATRSLARRVCCGELDVDAIDNACFRGALSLAAYPPPDLFIRTGGERRISNFLLWDLAYTELYFSDLLWPDFGADGLAEAVDWYNGRDRRFGGLG
ncbi:MAG: polyprenyl diphosphate synthase [Salinisphaera sp.]|nr:polyprenyl diphosphate synthase [Salinisphaera sp.]